MSDPYIYYIPIYADDDCSEALMHLFSGQKGQDTDIMAVLDVLDRREKQGEAVDYIYELETKLGLKHVSVHMLSRDRSHCKPIDT
ncbi:MAG: hypothetical protein WCO45_04130 [Pseudanabaena sp. ELA607]|jgi:hypothetical protein